MFGMETLHKLKKLGDESANMVIASLAEMTAMDVVMEVSAVNMTEIEQIPATVGITDRALCAVHR